MGQSEQSPQSRDSGADSIRWDWFDDESLPHRGEYVVMNGSEIVARCGPFKKNYETAQRIAAALRVAAETHRDTNAPVQGHPS